MEETDTPTNTLKASDLKPGETLDGRDLRGYTLEGDFSRRRMVGTILVDAVLDDCVLYGAILRFADLRNASLWFVDARRADLRGASLTGARVTGIRLCRALLDCARLTGSFGGPPPGKSSKKSFGMRKGQSELDKPEVKPLSDKSEICIVLPPMGPLPTDAEGAEKWKDEALAADTAKEAKEDAEDYARLQAWRSLVIQKYSSWDEEKVLKIMDLQGASLRNTQMQCCHFRYCNMIGARAIGADMSHMHAFHARLSGMFAKDANLTDARFPGAHCQPAPASAVVQVFQNIAGQSTEDKPTYLRRAILCRTDFYGADCTRVDFGDAKEISANFTKADVTGAQFTDVQLAKCKFDHAILSGAVMDEATFGKYPMPRAPKPPKAAAKRAAVRRLGTELGRAMMGDDEDDDDDDDGGPEENDVGDDLEAMTHLLEASVGRLVNDVATALPKVIAACTEAKHALIAAIETTRTALKGKLGDHIVSALDAAAAHQDRKAATVAIEELMRAALDQLLDAFEAELQMRLTKDEDEAAADAAADAHLVSQALNLLRATAAKHAEPLLQRFATGIAEKIDSKFNAPSGSRRANALGASVSVVKVMPDVESGTEDPLLANAPPASEYRKALLAIIGNLQKCLDDPAALVQAWLLQAGSALLHASNASLGSLTRRAIIFEKALKSRLSKEQVDMLGKQELGAALDKHVRSSIANRMLAAPSAYSAASKGCGGVLKLVWSSDPLVLNKHKNELAYLLEKLGKLEDANVTSDLWQDYYENWVSLLHLRPKLEAECAQRIFDAIATDESVLEGLAAAHLLKDAMISQGQVPAELLHQLKQGPAKHVKNHSYDYRKKIDAEIVKIGRIQGFRQWIIAQSIVAIGSVGIGLTTFVARLVFVQIYPESSA